MRKSVKALLSTAAATTLLLALAATPASAAQKTATVYTGGVKRGVCYVYTQNTSHYIVGRVYDVKADGIGVYGRFKANNGIILEDSDTDGTGNGYGEVWAYAANNADYFVSFECVSRDGGSSGWIAI